MVIRVFSKYARFSFLILLLVIALLLVACADQATLPAEGLTTPTSAASDQPIVTTLYLLNWQAPTILNPHLSAVAQDWEASRITLEPLASFDKSGNLVPFLAAEIPSQENGDLAPDLTWVTWKLKQGIKWSDGQPFTADDVRFTYEFIVNPAVASTSASTAGYKGIKNVEVIDDYTVKINFTNVNPAWALPFVGVQGVILPRHVFEAYNGANARQAEANTLPVGTGPYRVRPPGIKPQEVLLLGTQLVDTNKIVFEPNPYFRETGKNFFSTIEFKGGGTVREAARLALETGDVDYAFSLQLPPEELATLESAKQGHLITNFGSRVERLLLNHTNPLVQTADGEFSSLQFPHPFFSDKKVRQAFAYAIDREALAQLYGPSGQATTNNLVVPPQYKSPHPFYQYDPEKAKSLLSEAGWRDTDGDGILDKDRKKMQVVIESPIDTIHDQMLNMIKNNLNAVGVAVVPKRVDASIMFGSDPANPDNWVRFNADMELLWYTGDPDPGTFMQLWLSNQIPQKSNNWAGTNIERWINHNYDTLYQQSATEVDSEKRQELIIQMNDMLVEDVVMIPLVHVADVAGVSNALEGIDLTPWDANTWNIKDWRRSSHD